MRSRNLPFIDWLKAIGILLIVTGHVAARPFNHLAPPVYPKQLGVAMFLFVLGFALAHEVRARRHVLFNRLFDMYLYAIPLALIVSSLAPLRGTLNLSNYLPFMFGANVLINNFPANPTTWYVGTYLHILVAWALLIRFPVRAWMIPASLAAEIAIRAALAAFAGEYVAYMALSNWSTVFLFGLWWGQRQRAEDDARVQVTSGRWPWLAALAVFVAAWALWMPAAVTRWSFPFASLSAGAWSISVASACVSVAYLGYTVFFLQAVRRLPASRVVRFFARNTLVVFLAHMPVFRLLNWVIGPYQLPYAWAALVNMAVCFVGLAALSEVVNRLFAPRELRNRVAARLFGRRQPAPASIVRASA